MIKKAIAAALLAGAFLIGLSAPGFAFHCPADMAEIDRTMALRESFT